MSDNDTAKEISFRERLIMVEQQQSHQKEVLVEINDTLREVVKTQHILANQRKELDRLNKENEEIFKRLHHSDIEDAERRTREEHQEKLISTMHKKVIEDIEPQQQKTKTYFKIAAAVTGGAWALFLIGVKFWLETKGVG